MRKSKTMRAAVLLLALTLITSCFVGGTFAKYVTSASGNDSARVAYWGFNETDALTVNLFSVENDGETMSEDGTTKMLAPGTDGSTTFNFAYTNYQTNQIDAPEVDYKFEVKAEFTGAEGETADVDALDSNPNFTWKVTMPNGTEVACANTTAVKTALESLNGEYVAGTLPGQMTANDNAITVSWVWAYETAGEGLAAQDVIDTAMGNAQDLDDLKLTITITATQLDDAATATQP